MTVNTRRRKAGIENQGKGKRLLVSHQLVYQNDKFESFPSTDPLIVFRSRSFCSTGLALRPVTRMRTRWKRRSGLPRRAMRRRWRRTRRRRAIRRRARSTSGSTRKRTRRSRRRRSSSPPQTAPVAPQTPTETVGLWGTPGLEVMIHSLHSSATTSCEEKLWIPSDFPHWGYFLWDVQISVLFSKLECIRGYHVLNTSFQSFLSVFLVTYIHQGKKNIWHDCWPIC